MHSKHPKIQKLMDEVQSLDPKDSEMESKLQIIAKKIAIEQRKIKARAEGTQYNENDGVLIDPSEAFACEGCQ